MEKEERNIDEVETLKAEKEKYKRKFEELKIMEEARSVVSSLPKNFNKERKTRCNFRTHSRACRRVFRVPGRL